jgi:hypothetical protein
MADFAMKAAIYVLGVSTFIAAVLFVSWIQAVMRSNPCWFSATIFSRDIG